MTLKTLSLLVAFTATIAPSLLIAAPVPLEKGFVPLFNGKDLTGWTGAVKGYGVEKGAIYCKPQSGGKLLTDKEYSDYVLRFDFKLTANANNGLGIRCPLTGDAAYNGIELQVLDNSGSAYTKLKPYQYHGSVYGINAAKRGHQKKVGQWNVQEVRVIGTRITVILNGFIITDIDTAKIKEPFMDGKKHPGLYNKTGHIAFLGHGSRVDYRNIRIKEVTPGTPDANPVQIKTPPAGFTALFNGKDLTNWKGVTTHEGFDNPIRRQAATPEKRKQMQEVADKLMIKHWFVREPGVLFFDGKAGGYSLATAKDYGDFEMYVDWRLMTVRGDSGFYLRGTPQVQIWDAHNQWNIGSGGLYNNSKNSRALTIADHLVGDWNTFYIKMVGEKVTIDLNGVRVVDNITLENYWNRKIPVFPKEQIEIQCHGDPVEFANIFIKSLDAPATTATSCCP